MTPYSDNCENFDNAVKKKMNCFFYCFLLLQGQVFSMDLDQFPNTTF